MGQLTIWFGNGLGWSLRGKTHIFYAPPPVSPLHSRKGELRGTQNEGIGACAVNKMNMVFLLQRVKKLLKPTKEWGPRKEEHREAYLQSLQEGVIVKNGYVLAQTDGNNLVRRNDGHVPEEKTLLA